MVVVLAAAVRTVVVVVGRSDLSWASRRLRMTSATSVGAAATATTTTTTTALRQARQRRDVVTRRGASALMYASQQGDVQGVRKIIRAQPSSLLIRDRTGKSPLHYCCTSDNVCAAQAADLLVMAAPELVEGHDEDGFTPLHLAVIAGNMPLVNFLLANNADVNAVDNEKHTVVHWATVCGETAALRAVLAAGAPVSTPDIHGGFPLHYAAQMCGGEKDSSLGLQVLQTLLTHSDVAVSVEDGDGRQPLLWAASAGSAKAVLALIRAGALVEAPDKDGLTALHCAASRGHTDCIDSLLTLCGASPDVIDSNGCTALHYAVTLGHADATALLLAHGADPNRQDRKGRSPAHCGCAKGQLETVKMIGAHGANLWLRNARGDLPLHEAAASGRRDLVRWLLEMRPSQVNARNNDGRCPLHLAALNDNADMCKILLDAGAQINPILRTSKNIFMTPLDCALQRGFRSTAKYLQLHGGVPANRLGDSRRPKLQSGVNMQIRDDVTFWGDTSSDSERENGDSAKIKNVTQRKKLFHKYTKPRNGVDLDGIKPKNDKVESAKLNGNLTDKNLTDEKKSASRDSESSRLLNRKVSGRFDYTNEIIINGRTEINIHQTKQIVIGKELESIVDKNLNKMACQVDASKKVDALIDKDKRPRSAKYKVRDKSGRLSGKQGSAKGRSAKQDLTKSRLKVEDEAQTKIVQEQSQGQVPTGTGTVENKEENKVIQDDDDSTALAEQQSIRSNTSEDVEENKSLVVEAAVHEPPRETCSTEINMEDNQEEHSHTEQQKEQEAMQSEPNISKTELASTDTEIGKVAADKTHNEEENQDTVIEKESAENQLIINEEQHIEQISADIEVKEESEAANLETTNENEATSKLDGDGQSHMEPDDGTGQKQELVTQDIALVDSTQVDQAVEEDKAGELNQKDQEEQQQDQQQEHQQEQQEDTNEERSSTEIKEDLTAVTEPTPTEQKSSKTSKEAKEAQNEKQKTKRKHQRKKWSKKQGPAYEILDKTFADDEDLLETAVTLDKRKEEKQPEEKDESSDSSASSSSTVKEHKSFRVLDEKEAKEITTHSRRKSRKSKSPVRKQRSKSEEGTITERDPIRRSKIPTPLVRSSARRNDKYLHIPDRKIKSSMESRVPSLPNIHESSKLQREHSRSESNMSAPLLTSVYSDNERGSASDLDEDEKKRKSAVKKRKVKRKTKTRESQSAGSDYDSSNIIDSGFEPSPRSSRIPKWKHMSDRGVNMNSVTQTIQSNIRRYHLERKIFQHLLDLKRMQIRAGQHNESVLVKRAIESYHQSCASTVGAGRYIPEDFTFKSFERFLYHSLRKLQRNGADYLKGLPEAPTNPLLCTQSTHRCMHATHAYTGIPCAAYLPQMNHHTVPKIGFSTQCKPGTGFLPTINQKKAVTLELVHGNDKQIISLPADRLDQNKRYYVTFTVKGAEVSTSDHEEKPTGHTHSKSD